MTKFRFLLVPAVLASALVLLALSPVGAGRYRGQDQEVWWALQEMGAQPLRASLDGQFITAPGEEGYDPDGELFAQLLPGRNLCGVARGPGRQDMIWEGPGGASMSLGWRRLGQEESRALAATGDAWLASVGQAPFPDTGAKNSGLLVLRVDQPGQGSPAKMAQCLANYLQSGRLFQTYVATLPGVVPAPVLEKKARRLVGLLGGRVSEGVCLENLVSFSGYSPRLGTTRRTAAGSRLNVQVALRAKPDTGGTLIYVGIPLLAGSY